MADKKMPAPPQSPSSLYRILDSDGCPLYYDSVDKLLADVDESDHGRPVAVYTLARNTKVLYHKPRLK